MILYIYETRIEVVTVLLSQTVTNTVEFTSSVSDISQHHNCINKKNNFSVNPEAPRMEALLVVYRFYKTQIQVVTVLHPTRSLQ